MRRFVGAAVLAALLSPAAAVAAERPVDIVTEIVKLDKGDWAPVFDAKPAALMRRYFTAGFNQSWVGAMKHNQEGPVLDGDPITGGQGVTKITLKSASESTTGDRASVTTHVAVRTDGVAAAQDQTIVFALTLEGGAWKINDIVYQSLPSLRTYFRTNFKS